MSHVFKKNTPLINKAFITILVVPRERSRIADKVCGTVRDFETRIRKLGKFLT